MEPRPPITSVLAHVRGGSPSLTGSSPGGFIGPHGVGTQLLNIEHFRFHSCADSCDRLSSAAHRGADHENVARRVSLSRRRPRRRGYDHLGNRRGPRRQRGLGPIHQGAASIRRVARTQVPRQQADVARRTRRATDPSPGRRKTGIHTRRSQTRSQSSDFDPQPLAGPSRTQDQPQKKRSTPPNEPDPTSSPTASSGTRSPPASTRDASYSSTKPSVRRP